MTLRLPRPLADQIIARARAEAPDECWGLLAGTDGRVRQVFHVENGAPPEEKPFRYETEFRRDRDGWLLVLRDLDPRSPAIREVLQQILDLRGDDVAELSRRLPAVVMEGPRAELVRACQDLLTAGAQAEVRRV